MTKHRSEVARHQLSLLWDRLLRSVPVLGLIRGLAMRPERIQLERADDAAYRRIMFTLGEGQPKLLHDSENAMLWRIRGEQVGHLLGLAIGAVLLARGRPLRQVFVLTWALSFVLDWLGAELGVLINRRRGAS
jgi:hypothetical protein